MHSIVLDIFAQLKDKKCKGMISWHDVKYALSSLYGEGKVSFSASFLQVQFKLVKVHHD